VQYPRPPIVRAPYNPPAVRPPPPKEQPKTAPPAPPKPRLSALEELRARVFTAAPSSVPRVEADGACGPCKVSGLNNPPPLTFTYFSYAVIQPTLCEINFPILCFGGGGG